MPESAGRIDKWLWCAHIVKSRRLAHDMVATGAVRLNRRKVVKPGHDIKPGDVLTFVCAGKLKVLKVMAIPRRRERAAAARLLYEDLAARQ